MNAALIGRLSDKNVAGPDANHCVRGALQVQ
jgi:hypothetical protein